MKNFRIAALGCVVYLTMCAHSSPLQRQQSENQTNSDTTRSSAFSKIGDVPASQGPLRLECSNGGTLWLHDNIHFWRATTSAKWQLSYTSTSDTHNIKSIQFLTADVGWMLRFDGLYKTENGGVTWSPKNSGPIIYPEGDFRAFRFWREGLIGWAVGGVYKPMSRTEMSGSPPGNLLSPDGKGILVGAIYRTIDGATTWERQSVPERSGRFMNVFLLDPNHVIVTGDAGIYRTENGGTTWLPIKFNSQRSTANSSTGVPTDVSFVDVSTGWLSYTDGYAAKTFDGGRTWSDLSFAEDIWPAGYQPAYFAKIHFETVNHGWALGGDQLLYETKDGGQKWVRVDPNLRFSDMYFSNVCNGWLVSREGLFRPKS